MKPSSLLLGVALLLCACSSAETDSGATRYKLMTTEYPLKGCVGYGQNGTAAPRGLAYAPLTDGRFFFEACAVNPLTEGVPYTGPTMMRVLNAVDGSLVIEQKWEDINLSQTKLNALYLDDGGFDFSDGKNQFYWKPSTGQLALKGPRLQVLDYPRCIGMAAFGDEFGKTAFLFERCYTSTQKTSSEPVGTPGVLRLSQYPGGKELLLERPESLDVRNIEWDFETRTLRFENNGKPVEWALPVIELPQI